MIDLVDHFSAQQGFFFILFVKQIPSNIISYATSEKVRSPIKDSRKFLITDERSQSWWGMWVGPGSFGCEGLVTELVEPLRTHCDIVDLSQFL